MRVGLVVPGFSADADDWCIPALRHFVRRLATTDDVDVLALRYPYRTDRYELFGARVTALGGGQRRRWGSVGVWRSTLATLAAEHRRRRFDVLHAFWATETGALTALAARLLGVPGVVSVAGGELVGLRDIGYGDQLTPTERLKVSLALRAATLVTGGSQYVLGLARSRLPHRGRGRVVYAPFGVDLDLFRPPNSTAQLHSRSLVSVGSLAPVKDPITLLRAVAALGERGVACALDLVGDGPLEATVRSMARRLPASTSARLQGAVPHDRLPSIYGGSAAFVLASRHEAQGMAALEAAACGLPVVGTRVGIVPELAPLGGIAVPVGDAQELADAIAALLESPARRVQMGQAARARVEAGFELGQCVDRFRGIYQQVLATPG